LLLFCFELFTGKSGNLLICADFLSARSELAFKITCLQTKGDPIARVSFDESCE